MTMTDARLMWEQPEVVERFASQKPDHRLVALLDAEPSCSELRALDLGCAGGRNTVLLVERGVSVVAVDTSVAMVERTRQRLAEIQGSGEALGSVRQGPMNHLGWAPDATFDLVVALGVYQNAATQAEWRRALAETRRVLAPGGRVLVASFTPRTDLNGKGVRAVAGEPNVFEGFATGRGTLVDAETLDREMARVGLLPRVATATVEVATKVGRRVTANGLYGRPLP